MLNPKDVLVSPPRSGRDLSKLEEIFDAAITRASESGQWPARVPRMRWEFSRNDLHEVALKYRGGLSGDPLWIVEIPEGGDAVVLIDHPGRQRGLREDLP